MANKYANLTPSKNINEDFQTITIGFDRVQTDMDTINTNVNKAQSDIDTHKTSSSAHGAQNITYSGKAVGNNTKEAIDYTNERIDNLIITSGDSSPEVADARGQYPVLSARLDAFDDQLAETVKKSEIAANVLDFGAVGDGVTDDTAAFQAAINTGRKVIVPWTSNGYKVGSINCGDETEIEGENAVTLLGTKSYIFGIAATRCKISNFRIDMINAPVNSVAILLRTSIKVCYLIRLNRLFFINCYHSIIDESGNDNYVTGYPDGRR